MALCTQIALAQRMGAGPNVILEKGMPLADAAREEEASNNAAPIEDRIEGFVTMDKLKKLGKQFAKEEEDSGASSVTSSTISARFWLDGPEAPDSTEAESADSASLAMSSSVGSMHSVVDYFSPEETIIIFDWDDTICPTTALNEDYTLQPGSESLQELVHQARQTIEKAREVAAEVVIVTNATEGWVEKSCENWLPGLRPTLDMLEFASARSTWEPMGIKTPTGWKAAAFEQILRRFYSRNPDHAWKNVIVIGDACYEHDALNQVASLAPQGADKRCRAKSIRFALRPSVEVLTRELQMLRESFDDIVRHDDNLDLHYNSTFL